MPRNRTFVREESFPSYFVNRQQDFISMMDAGLALSVLNGTTVQVVAGAENGQVAIGIQGLWRFRETSVTRAHPGGVAGLYRVYVVALANSVASTPQPNTDNTDYSFDLRVTPDGTLPSGVGVSVFREIGDLTWDGGAITELRQTAGARANTGAVRATASHPSETPARVAGIAGQVADLQQWQGTPGGAALAGVSATGGLRAASFAVGAVALASTHLSDSAALARLAGPTFTGTVTLPTAEVTTFSGAPNFAGPVTGPTAAAGTNTGQLATTAFVTAAVAGVSGGTGGIAYLGNTQTFTAPNVFATTLQVGAVATGALFLVPGNSGNCGYLEFTPPDGLRNGFIGYTPNAGGISYSVARGNHTFSGGSVVIPTAAVTTFSGAPNFVGAVTGPTAAAGNSTTQLATTAFVTNAVQASAPAGTAFLANNQTFSGVNTFSQSPVVPTAPAGTNTTAAASTAFVIGQGYATQGFVTGQGYATQGFVTGQGYATQAFVTGQGYITNAALGGYAPLNSPSFTGAPAAPTAAAGANSTQIATTAFVQGAVQASSPAGAAYLGNGQTFTGLNTFTQTVAVSSLKQSNNSAGNLHLDAGVVGGGTNAIYLNLVQGAGGVYFGNGAGAAVGSVSAGGVMSTNGDHYAWSGSALQTRIGNSNNFSSVAFGAAADTVIWREAAQALKTGASFDVGQVLRASTGAGAGITAIGNVGPGGAACVDFGAGSAKLYNPAFNQLRTDGSMTAASFPTSSDARLKENVTTVAGGLAKARALRGVEFDWKDPERKGRRIGFIAQEAAEVLPCAVIEGSDGMLTLNYTDVVPLLVEAIKELSTKVDALEAVGA